MTIVTKFACWGLSAAFLIGAATSALAANDPAVAPPGSIAGAQSKTVVPAVVKPNTRDKVICKTDAATASRLGGPRTSMRQCDEEQQASPARLGAHLATAPCEPPN